MIRAAQNANRCRRSEERITKMSHLKSQQHPSDCFWESMGKVMHGFSASKCIPLEMEMKRCWKVLCNAHYLFDLF